MVLEENLKQKWDRKEPTDKFIFLSPTNWSSYLSEDVAYDQATGYVSYEALYGSLGFSSFPNSLLISHHSYCPEIASHSKTYMFSRDSMLRLSLLSE